MFFLLLLACEGGGLTRISSKDAAPVDTAEGSANGGGTGDSGGDR